MRPRAIVAVTAIAAASLVAGGWGAASAQATTTCTWGGTPANPTGEVWYTGQGITNTPSTEPLPFIATGPLAAGGGVGRGARAGRGEALGGRPTAGKRGRGAPRRPGVVVWGVWAPRGGALRAPATTSERVGGPISDDRRGRDARAKVAFGVAT